MTMTTTILCDGCEKDITTTRNSVDYRIHLESQDKTRWYVTEGFDGGAVTSMHISNPLPRDKHFCRFTCLAIWLEREGHFRTPDSLVTEIFEKQNKINPDEDPGDLTITIQDDTSIVTVVQ